MEKIYFISDVHLGAHSARIEEIKLQRLSAFLANMQNHANILYIVGDLYDFWFEYRHAIPKVSLRILFQLNQLVEAGIQVNYFTGNHDLWIGDYLQTQIGFEVYREPYSVTHNNVQLFIAHGDGLAKGEKRLRFLKRIFNNPINIALYRLIHPDIGLPLMKLFAKKSRERGENP
ncbi:UDP-2,3-diacylglucosamine diphosphatase, partial [candidate division KSB1 bacterium]|nr:UDP-2,3-diacylglucosamine diphosphatase [candidate division KSB1 bacterium]NIR69910.1 UDP-2,3-diacylglucosamine diphosphatase [candidate division KSB1 bacterium]NIS25819.1 UDP-2,3-diacylglucosamine diphosphatase [candidate division KSB1 bacterium]NIT72694.1 UDP-2,3-diacylglucosamine diphosphatase [candidate division KSB1 bacterium]NIU26508.1 UDP-2,3-diacylglucosamine diphosphatase [candidate division KSB1 bacterium]